jgi:hypothetical protein
MPEPFDAGDFCKGKDTGTYETDGFYTIDCNNDHMGGGWAKVFSVKET